MAELNQLPSEMFETESRNQRGSTPPPSYEDAIGPSMDIALRKEFMCDSPMTITIEGMLNDYWVYSADRTLLFRTHRLVVGDGTKVTHVRTNKQAFFLRASKRKGDWRYFAENDQDDGNPNLFEIDSHDRFIKGTDSAFMTFRNACTQSTDILEIRRNREQQRWDISHKDLMVATISFPSSVNHWKISILGRGVDPSILVAITLVLIVGVRKLEQ